MEDAPSSAQSPSSSARSLVLAAQKRVQVAREKRCAATPASTAEGVTQGLLCVGRGLLFTASPLLSPAYAASRASEGDRLRSAAVAAAIATVVAAPVKGVFLGGCAVAAGVREGRKARRFAEALPAALLPGEADLEAMALEREAMYGYGALVLSEEGMMPVAGDAAAAVRTTALVTAAPNPTAPGCSAAGAAAAPCDLTYYHVLRLEPAASAADIADAYRAHVEGKRTGEADRDRGWLTVVDRAHVVLSDPERREFYHRHGLEGVCSDAPPPPELLLSLMFRPNRFHPLVGDVSLAATLSSPQPGLGVDDVENASIADQRRVATLTRFLTRRVALFVDGRREEFASFAAREALFLSKEPFGRDILHTVGRTYMVEARKFLAGAGKFTAGTKDRGNGKAPARDSGLSKHLGASAALTEMSYEERVNRRRRCRKVDKEGEAREEGAEELHTAVSELLIAFVRSMVEVQQVLRRVVEGVCRDAGMEQDVLHRRASAISALGRIFTSI